MNKEWNIAKMKEWKEKLKAEEIARDLSEYFADLSDEECDTFCSILYELEHDGEREPERHGRFKQWLENFSEDDIRGFAVFGLKCHKLMAQMNARLCGDNPVWDKNGKEFWYLDDDGTYKQWKGEE